MYERSRSARRASALLLLAASALVLTPDESGAQTVGVTTGFGVRGTAGYYSIGGEDFEGAEGGPGFGASLHYAFLSGGSIMGTIQSNSHDLEGNEDELSVLSITAEPRYYFKIPTAPSLCPFIGGRVAWLHGDTKASTSLGTFDASANGFALGVSGGLLVQLSRRLGVESGVNVNAVSFGDVSVDGQELSNTDTSGTAVGVFAGIVLSFPAR